MSDPLSPVQLERELSRLREANENAALWLETSEIDLGRAQAAFELSFARARLSTFTGAVGGEGWTVGRREDYAIEATAELKTALITAEAQVKAAKARVNGIRVSLDALRSQSALLRSALETA